MRKKWTEKEVQYLHSQRYMNQSSKTTAKALNRSVYSVKRKAESLGINKYSDFFSAKALSKCFNVDFKVIIRWIEKFNLPCEKIIYDEINHYDIDLEKFWQWAEHHKNIINWSKYDRNSLPLEPEWVQIEKNNCKCPKNRARWTEQDLRMIRSLLRSGKSYREIASQMGRTYYSINHLMRSGKVYQQ